MDTVKSGHALMRSLDELEWHVLDAMADDWESIVQIRPHLTEFVGPISDQAIFNILRKFHELGLVRMMDASGVGSETFPAEPIDHWFSMTEVGRELWEAVGHVYRDDE